MCSYIDLYQLLELHVQYVMLFYLNCDICHILTHLYYAVDIFN